VFYTVLCTCVENKMHNIIFIGKPENPTNRKISIFLFNNITYYFMDNFIDLFNQVPT
jgi:hypothetical protein